MLIAIQGNSNQCKASGWQPATQPFSLCFNDKYRGFYMYDDKWLYCIAERCLHDWLIQKAVLYFFVFWVSGQMDHQDTLGITI
jgi:hypothetical protein